ncbi:MAG: MFS transporter [Clostridiaceae bacterium]|nr:MFS transporter [Clostridiaceae bacterium]
MDKQYKNNTAQNNYSLSVNDYEKSRLMVILEGISARIIFGLTTGAFLTGYLKFLGADDELCGQIAAIPVLSSVIQFFTPMFLEKLNRKKPIVTFFNAFHRILLVLLVFVPILPVSVAIRLYITGGLYLLSNLMVNMVAPATTTMFISLVPQKMRGRFFSIREKYLIFISSVVNVVLGGILDKFELRGKTYEGYILMFAIVFIAMIMNLVSYLGIKEPPLSRTKSKISLKNLFTMPLKENRFRKIIILFFLWGLSVNFSSPFFSVYMVSKLELSYTFITICGLVNSLCYVIAVSVWGKMADKKSFTYTAMISIALLGVTHIIWFLAANGTFLTYLIIMLVHITGGISWAGIGISLYNIPYEYTPEEGRTVYLGFNAALSGLIGFISSMLASYMVGAMSDFNGIFLGLSVTQFQLIFLISGLLILVTSAYIRFAIRPEK